MLRPVLTFAAVGAVGVIAWKLMWIFLIPLLGTLLGFLVGVVKFVVLIALVIFAWWLIRRGTRRPVELV